MPSRTPETPTGLFAAFNGHLYVAYSGEYGNVSDGYPLQTQVRAGVLVRTVDGVSWATVWDGHSFGGGYNHWQPRNLWVANGALYCVIVSAGFNWVVTQAYIPAGAIALIKSTNGTTWTLVHTFHSWPQQSLGSSSPSTNWGPDIRTTVWLGRRSGPGGEDMFYVIAGWNVFVNGSGGSFTDQHIQLFESADMDTWTFVREMLGSYPFATLAGGPGPYYMTAVRRLDALSEPDRWWMLGGSGGANWSDDLGVSWTPSSFFTNFPTSVFALNNSGMVMYADGTASFAPDVKISCDFGESFVTMTGPGNILGPAGAALVPVQFDGMEEMIVACRDNVDSTTKTAIWYTQQGGESFIKLGVLDTAFFVPYWLAWVPEQELLILWTRDRAIWYCNDTPDFISTPRTVCPDLFVPEDEVEFEEIPYMPGMSGIGPPIRVRMDSESQLTPTTTRRERPMGA